MPNIPPESGFRKVLEDKKLFYTQNIHPFLKQHKTSLILFTVALAPLLTYIALSTYNQARSEWILYSHQKQQEEGVKKQREEYQKLLESQSRKSESQSQNIDEESRKAIGRHTLHVFLVKSPALDTSSISGLTEKLAEKDRRSITSLYYLNTFYNKWAEKYDINDFKIELKFHGPYDLGTLEQVGDMALYWGKDPFATTRLQDSFNKLITNNDIKVEEKDLSIFLYFDNSFTEVGSIDQDRFYEHKKFRSFADQNTGKAYINVYNLDSSFAKTVTEIVAHEVLHLFGANDKYEESESVTRLCSERGRGDLDLRPRVPQETADIMCMYIEKEGDKFKRGSFASNTLSINQLTAKEIGWKKD